MTNPMLRLDLATVSEWLQTQPGGHCVTESGLGEDAMASVSMALENLAERFETELASDPDAFSARLTSPAGQTAFRQLAQHLSIGRRLRILAWLVEAKVPNAGLVLTSLFNPDGAPAGSGPALLGDVRRLHRAALLEEMFATERTALVMAACNRGKLQ